MTNYSAKHWSIKAEKSSEMAKTSEQSALTYKNSAQTSAQNAANSATTATNAANSSNVQTVVTNISAINNCSTNMSAIKDAPNQANRAKQYADQAQFLTEGSLNKTHITNCITEIPQDIKLELNNGTLTLKAGSKVYVPNGVGVFDEVTISNDVSFNNSVSGVQFICYSPSNNALMCWNSSVCSSGNTMPSTQHFYWYDTTNNLAKVTSDYGSTTRNVSLPLAICSASGGITSIDQVFNGFGYIGSTVFALPGVKGLIPNGRNADGSLKNIEFVNPVVKTYSVNGTYNNLKMVLATTGIGVFYYAYDDIKNAIYRTDTGAYFSSDRFIVADISFTNSRITSLQPKTSFHSVDYNDTVLNYGDQDIGGNKNYLDTITVECVDSSKVPFRVRRSDITYGTKPSETKEGEVIRLVDSTNHWLLGALKYKYKTDGSFSFYLLGRSPFDSSKYTANVGLGYLADGTPYVMGVQPPTNSNSTSSMPTTGWTRTVCVGNPNYNAAISRTVGTTYTAATNGWIRVDSVQKDNTTCKVIVDGVHTPYQVFCGENFNGNVAIIIPIIKGQTYKGENLVSMWWYPSI